MNVVVVTPTLGTSPWLADAVASVAALPLAITHVLVAPAGAATALVTRFPRAIVMAEPTPGCGMYAAINAGLAAVPGWDAFTYLNDDDLLLRRFAVVVARAADAGARGGRWLIYGRVRLIDAAGRRLGAIPVSPRPSLNRALYAQRLEPVYQHGTLVARGAREQVGGFDEAWRYCGDSEYLARLCVAGVPAIKVRGEVAAFRLHLGQLTKNRAVMLAERARVDEKLGLLEWRHPWQRVWARLLFRTANLPVYAERLARHGWVSFDELLVRSGASRSDRPQS
jgi:GT2 family glycosyltransferase